MNEDSDIQMKERLRKLGVNRLADALLTLASRNDDAADYVARLISTPEEGNVRIRMQLDEFADSGYLIDDHESHEFLSELEGFIEDVRMNIVTPEEGIEVLTKFYEADQAVLERCDDSMGLIGEVFRWDAVEAFVEFAKKCKDKDALVKRVASLYIASEYGVRDTLIERASEFLSQKRLKDMVKAFWEHIENAGDESSPHRHTLSGIEMLAKQLKDPALFEKARLHACPEPSIACCIDIAQLYVACRQDEKALAWLERVQDSDDWRVSERDDLLFTVLKRMGEKKKAEEVAWRIFRRHRSKDTFKQLLTVVGKRKSKQILEEQAREIMGEKQYLNENAVFLVAMRQSSEAAAYVLQNAAKLNGEYYLPLIALAQSMEEEQQFLAATALYRALLDAILSRAQSKAYHYGAIYLHKLDAMADKLSSWEPMSTHEAYKEALVRDHKRKWRFWEEYGERP